MKYIYIDESGELEDFAKTGSSYFVCTAVVMDSINPASQMKHLRHQLEYEGYWILDGFHAKNDPKPRRERVFECIYESEIKIYAVVLDKSKVNESLRERTPYLYGLTCKCLLSYMARTMLKNTNEKIHVIVSSFSTGNVKIGVRNCLDEVIKSCFLSLDFRISHWRSSSDYGLQIADYCSWAMGRLYEKNDYIAEKSISYLREKIMNIFEPFKSE